MKKHWDSRYYKIYIKRSAIIIYFANQNIDQLVKTLGSTLTEQTDEIETKLKQFINYSPELRFILVDENKRYFITERLCYLGPKDNWITIDKPKVLKKLAKKYVKHIGKESFFELF